MNNRYFGNIHDFCKYGLLRLLGEHLSLGVCWMLTHGVGKPEGSGYEYLVDNDPFEFRRHDPELFDWLLKKRQEWNGGEWGVGMIEKSGMIPEAGYFSTPMPPTFGEREGYFRKMRDAFRSTQGKALKDVVFLDPDFGVGFAPREFTGERGNGYLRASEIARCLHSGFSVLFYQDWHWGWHGKFDRRDPEGRDAPERRIRAALREEGVRTQILSLDANAEFMGRRAQESGGTLARFFLVQHDKHAFRVERFVESFRNSCWCKSGLFIAPRVRIGVFIDAENTYGAPEICHALDNLQKIVPVGEGVYGRVFGKENQIGRGKSSLRDHYSYFAPPCVVGMGVDEAEVAMSADINNKIAKNEVDAVIVFAKDKLNRPSAKFAKESSVPYYGIGNIDGATPEYRLECTKFFTVDNLDSGEFYLKESSPDLAREEIANRKPKQKPKRKPRRKRRKQARR